MKEHMPIYTGEKPHAYDVCGKQYTRLGNQKTQMLIHTGEKPHDCFVCGKQLTQAHNLKVFILVRNQMLVMPVVKYAQAKKL